MNCENKRNHWLHTMQTYVSVRQRKNNKFNGTSKYNFSDHVLGARPYGNTYAVPLSKVKDNVNSSY